MRLLPKYQIIAEFIRRIEDGYYEVIDGALHRKNKKLGTVGKNGYMSHSIKEGRAYAHRILFAYYHGLDELKKFESINHIDGNKLNNSIENLEGMSLAENTKHQWLSDLGVSGSKCSYAKITENDVLQIKKLLKQGFSQYLIAEHFNVSRSTVLNIHLDKTWRNVGFDESIEVPNFIKTKRYRSDRALTEIQVNEITELCEKGVTRRLIANKFGVSRGVINKIAWGLY